ncbi:hypothetical protein ABPG75_003351 [Micractinium tetrahymenae]
MPTASAGPAASELAAPKLAVADIMFATVGGGVWAIASLKMAPAMSAANNAQAALGMAAIFAVSLAWPKLRPASYRRWRVPALVAVRLLLILMPINFSTEVFDAMAPHLGTGRLAWLTNISPFLMGTHLTQLLLVSLGWRLPMRVHIPLQAFKVLALARFAMDAHCRSQLMRSPEVVAVVKALHSSMNLVAECFLPAGSLAGPRDLHGQTVAMLLFCWVLLGWVLPTLLLLWPLRCAPPCPAGSRAASGSGGSRRASRQPSRLLGGAAALACKAVDGVEAALRLLLPAPPLPARQDHMLGPGPLTNSARLPLALRWMAALAGTWLACCAAVPLVR